MRRVPPSGRASSLFATRALAPAAALAGWSASASACPYCAAASGPDSGAYFASAVALGLLPIGFGVGLVLWLRARFLGADDRQAGPGEASTRDEIRSASSISEATDTPR